MLKTLADGGGLARHPFVRTAWTKQGRGALLFVGGAAFPMGLASARALAAAEFIDAAKFGTLDKDAQAALVALAIGGSYALQRSRKGKNR